MSYMSGYNTSPGGSRRESPRPRVKDSRPVYNLLGSMSHRTQPLLPSLRYVRASDPVEAPSPAALEDESHARRTSSCPTSQDHTRRTQPIPVILARSLYERQVAAHHQPRLSPVDHHATPLTVRSLWECQVTESPTRRPFYDECHHNPLPVRSHCERQVTAGRDLETSHVEQLTPVHMVRSTEERQVPVASLPNLPYLTSSRHPLNGSLDRKPRSMRTQSSTLRPDLDLPSITHTYR